MSRRIVSVHSFWSEMSLIEEKLLETPTTFAGSSEQSHLNCTCLHVNIRREICQASLHQIHQYFPSKNLFDHGVKLLLICLPELCFGFEIDTLRLWVWEIAVLLLIRSQCQLACEGLYIYEKHT